VVFGKDVQRPERTVESLLEGDLVADISDARIGYEVSNIAVGTGFNRSRPLDGAIRDFTLEYQLREERPQARGVILHCSAYPFWVWLGRSAES